MLLNRNNVIYLFNKLNGKLKQKGMYGEILICGGALVALQYNDHRITQDIDAIFEPKSLMNALIVEIAKEENLSPTWMNDNVKVYLKLMRTDSKLLCNLSNLKVKGVTLPVLISMKLMSFRWNKDLEDITNLIIEYGKFNWDELIRECSKYAPKDRLLWAKTMLSECFRGVQLKELVFKHYLKKVNMHDVAEACADLVLTIGLDQCPSIRTLTRTLFKESVLEGKKQYLIKLLNTNKIDRRKNI